MPVAPLKDPKTYEEQIDILRNKHGLTINDDKTAEDILTNVNYYRLSAYGISLRSNGTNSPYKQGTTIEQIYGLYRFDRRLRNLLMGLLDPFEISLRSRIAYQLGHSYGADGYLNQINFSQTMSNNCVPIHHTMLTRFYNECTHSKEKPCVKHHINTYGGKFPIWAAIELFTFGMLSTLYSIMKTKDQNAVAVCFNEKGVHFTAKIHALSNLRNICAHNDRIYDIQFSTPVSLNSRDKQFVPSVNNRIFPLMLVLRNVTKNNDLWEWFYCELCYLIQVHPEVNLSLIGFPSNWQDALQP